jgi:hypothetical protein
MTIAGSLSTSSAYTPLKPRAMFSQVEKTLACEDSDHALGKWHQLLYLLLGSKLIQLVDAVHIPGVH